MNSVNTPSLPTPPAQPLQYCVSPRNPVFPRWIPSPDCSLRCPILLSSSTSQNNWMTKSCIISRSFRGSFLNIQPCSTVYHCTLSSFRSSLNTTTKFNFFSHCTILSSSRAKLTKHFLYQPVTSLKTLQNPVSPKPSIWGKTISR